ncbi:MAG: LysR family transcriptional regulator [Pseudomonadales bacterium]
MKTQVDLKRMRYIVEVARAQSITTAAETLGLTQPALTRSIAEVEQELGTRLFHRQPRGMQLTEAGTRFVQHAKRILGEVDDLVADLREGPNLLTGRLRIGLAPAGFIYHAIPALRRLARDYPGIKIEIVDGAAQSLCPRLLQGELNGIVGSSSYLRRWRELEVELLRPMYFGCMVRKDHPVGRLAQPTEADILRYPVVLPASVEPVYSDIAQRYAHHGEYMQPQYVTDNFDLTRALVQSTDAYHPVHHPEPDFGGLREQFLILENLIPLPEHHLSFACSSVHPKTEALERFQHLLSESLRRPSAA